MMKKAFLVFAGMLLFSAYAAEIEVFSLGTPGMPVSILKDARLQKALDLKPELTILMIGTNDTVNSTSLTPLPEFEEHYARVVRQLLESGSRLILVTVPPCSESLLFMRHKAEKFGSQSPNARIIEANKVIRAIAEKNKVPLVDFYSEVQKKGTAGKESLIRNPENNGGTDGIHPTPEGYRRLAEMVCQTMRSNRISAQRIVCLGDSITYGANVKGAGTVGGDTYPGQLLLMLKDLPK